MPAVHPVEEDRESMNSPDAKKTALGELKKIYEA